jgi:shikimate kinase
MRNKILIGETASGKSTYGKKIAKIEGKTFYDLDIETEKEILKKGYGETINEAYKKLTKEEISMMFEKTFEKLIEEENVVIATGGYFGTYYNFEKIKEKADIIYLKPSKELWLNIIKELQTKLHLKENQNRRILFEKDKEKVEAQYDKREKLYKEKATKFIKYNSFDELNNTIKKKPKKQKTKKESLKIIN